MSPHQLHNQQVPFRICPYSLRQLCGHRNVRTTCHSSLIPWMNLNQCWMHRMGYVRRTSGFDSNRAHEPTSDHGCHLKADELASIGLAMSRIPWACSILPVRKITTVCDRYRIPKPTSSSFASASHHPLPSKTSARNGSPRFTTTALASPA